MTFDSLPLIAGILAAIALFVTIRRYARRQWLRGHVDAIVSLALVMTTAALVLLVANLHSYQRLTYEQPVADVSIKRIGRQHYELTLTSASAEAMRYDIFGDDWQLDARVLKWHPYANLLGLDLHYRLDRISGRYQQIDEERNRTRSVYSLHDGDTVELWELANRYPRWFPFVDALYGSATYVPLNDQAQYQVFASQSGLVARPVNEAARAAVRRWDSRI